MTDFPVEDNVGTMAVQERHRFDVPRLAAWLETRLPGFKGPLTVAEFKGGQSNPTYRLTSATGEYVLRRKPPGRLLKSAHAVEREYRVLTALAQSEVPVPKTFCLCEDEAVIGSVFYVMEFLDGRVIWDFTDGPYTPAERAAIWDAANLAVTRVHQADVQQLGLADFGRPGNYVARQLRRWTSQYEITRTVDNPYMDRLLEYLPEHLPRTEPCCLVHGDPQLANMLLARDRAQVIGILDWELATLGNPYSDFAYLCRPYRAELRGLDLARLGIPEEADFVATYCERMGLSGIPDWDFYMAFNMFRLAAILQGIAKRALDGTASNLRAEEAGARALETARLGWAQLDKSVPLD